MRSRFVDVAADWMSALLGSVDKESQGVDLFGRDALLLGRVLVCLVRQPASQHAFLCIMY